MKPPKKINYFSKQKIKSRKKYYLLQKKKQTSEKILFSPKKSLKPSKKNISE